MTTVTLLHPGAMGAAVAAQAVKAGHEVLWVPEGRSDATHRRAKKVGATACESLDEALERSEIVLSICPPQAAEDVATTVAYHAFAGVYVDANAINPQRMQRIAEEIRPGAMVLDGAIFGPPPGGQRAARLYLAGEAQAVDTVQPVFKDTPLHVRRASGSVGSASALKMAFASYQKAARTLAGCGPRAGRRSWRRRRAHGRGAGDGVRHSLRPWIPAQRGRTRLALGSGDGGHRRNAPRRRVACGYGRSGGRGHGPLGRRQGPLRPVGRRGLVPFAGTACSLSGGRLKTVAWSRPVGGSRPCLRAAGPPRRRLPGPADRGACAAQDVRRPAVRDLVADMAARDRRRTLPELHHFSRRLGVPA